VCGSVSIVFRSNICGLKKTRRFQNLGYGRSRFRRAELGEAYEDVYEEMASNPDFDLESHRHYGISAAQVVRSRRENMRPRMTLTADWRVNATSEEVRRYDDECDRKRRKREERFRPSSVSTRFCFPGGREGKR